MSINAIAMQADEVTYPTKRAWGMLHAAGAGHAKVLPHDKKPDRLIICDAEDVLLVATHFHLVVAQHLAAKACWLESRDKTDVPLTVGWSAHRKLQREGYIAESHQDYPTKYYAVTKQGERTAERLRARLEAAKKPPAPPPVILTPEAVEEPTPPPAQAPLKAKDAPIPGMHATMYRIDGRNAMTLIFENALGFSQAKAVLGIKDPAPSTPKEPAPQETANTRECFYCGRSMPERPGRKPWRVACEDKACQELFISDTDMRAEMKAAGLNPD